MTSQTYLAQVACCTSVTNFVFAPSALSLACFDAKLLFPARGLACMVMVRVRARHVVLVCEARTPVYCGSSVCRPSQSGAGAKRVLLMGGCHYLHSQELMCRSYRYFIDTPCGCRDLAWRTFDCTHDTKTILPRQLTKPPRNPSLSLMSLESTSTVLVLIIHEHITYGYYIYIFIHGRPEIHVCVWQSHRTPFRQSF
jgi:hypothetical protein